jgi:predicted ferric reductase
VLRRPSGYLARIRTIVDVGYNLRLPSPLRIPWLRPLQLGKLFLLLTFSGFVCALVLFKVIKHDIGDLERLGFRTAWIGATMTPLVVLLSSRFSAISLLTGVSYERLNWLHRWVSRTLIIVSTLHGLFFLAEWLRAGNGFFWLELKTLPRIYDGIGALAVLFWIGISAASPLRGLAYELFVVQHFFSAVTYLLLLWIHARANHRFSLICAMLLFSIDLLAKGIVWAWQNIRLTQLAQQGSGIRLGYNAKIEVDGPDISRVTVEGVYFSWRPGQHIYIWMPSFWLQSPHPFTIANSRLDLRTASEIQLIIRKRKGFTKKIHESVCKATVNSCLETAYMRVFIAGPFGNPPRWEQYDTLVLISTSTGGSFVTPILQNVLLNMQQTCVRCVSVLLIARKRHHIDVYLSQIQQLLDAALSVSINVNIEAAVTGDMYQRATDRSSMDESRIHRQKLSRSSKDLDDNEGEKPLARLSIDSMLSVDSVAPAEIFDKHGDIDPEEADVCRPERTTVISQSIGRPSIETYLRNSLTDGHQAAVAVCAGPECTIAVQKAVDRISCGRKKGDSRIPEIFLHVEQQGL